MNIYIKLRLYLCAVLVVFVSTSFQNVESRKLIVYKPAKDFSFITTYYCIYDLFGEEQWTKNTGRSFDKNGVHLTNNAYHPVNACHYALFCYDEYKKTGDEKFKKAMLAQVGYLRDSTKYHEFDGYKVGYPYLNSWHDLKAPWYSALAQSEAISVLVRYYALTNDKTILPLIVKLKNFMIAPQTDGKGTLSYTPEGNIWFEEYPNSPQERQVLNGFFLALVALHDYTHLFPDDEEAKDLYAKAIVSAKESVKFYDTGSWLKYNRGDQRLVANGYMKWQVLEMKLVYEVTKDEFFKNQYALWATYAYEKPYETPGCKLPYYNFSVPLADHGNGQLTPPAEAGSIPVSLSSLLSSIDIPSVALAEYGKIYDNKPNTFVTLKKADSVSSTIRFSFRSAQKLNSIKISLARMADFSDDDFELMYSEGANSRKKIAEIGKAVTSQGTLTANFDDITASEIYLNIRGEQDNLMLSEIQFTAPGDKYLPEFYHYLTPVYNSGNGGKFSYDSQDMKDVVIYYRASNTKEDLMKIIWSQERLFRSNKEKLMKDDNKFYQFLIIGKPDHEKATFKNISFNS